MRTICFKIITAILLASSLTAQTQASIPGEELTIKLVTIDPGNEVTMWWGHTGIIVENRNLQAAAFYNYGLFSFDQENFMLNFAQGRLIFWVGVWDAELALEFYKSLDRTIRIQTLDLPPEKKRQMAFLLAENVLPQNREYLYDHYFDNCATRVRDIFNQLLDGQFFESTKIPGRMTLREHTRCHTHRNYFMDWLLMFLMNDSIDKPIKKWDEMFLPTELEMNIGNMMYTDSSGISYQLVSNTSTYYQAKNAYQVPVNAPKHWLAALLAGLLLSGLFLLFSFSYNKGSRIGKYVFGVYHIFLGLILGIPGFALFVMSLFTDHIVTYYNENLLLANPLTLLLLIAGYGILRQKISILKYMPIFTTVLLFLAIILLILKLFPVFDQDNILAIVSILPTLIALTISWNKLIPRCNRVQ